MNLRLVRLFGGWLMLGPGAFCILNWVFAPSIWPFVWMLSAMGMLPLLLWGSDHVWGMRVLAWLLPHLHVVRIMHYDGEVRHVLAQGEWGQVLHAHIHWATEIGRLQLHPNGLVTGASYVYFWEPLDTHALYVMHLTYDCEDWHKLQTGGYGQREEYRHALKQSHMV